MSNVPRLRKSRGFTLVEVGIASVLLAMLVSGILILASDYIASEVATAKGQELSVVNSAVTSYEQKYATNLANSTAIPIPGYASVANPYAPTPTELFHLGLLGTPVPDALYGVKINTTLVNGMPNGLTWLVKPFVSPQGYTDVVAAGQAMLAAGGDAAMSTIANPAQVVGADGWSATNPISGNPPAVLAMRSGAGSAAYVRLDGSTPMQGSLNLAAHDIQNANNLAAATLTATGSGTFGGSASAATLTATGLGDSIFFGSSRLYSDGWNTIIRSAGGPLYVENNSATAYEPDVARGYTATSSNGLQVGNVTYYGDSANSAIRQPGGLYVQNQWGSGAAPLDASRITAEEYVQVNGVSNQGWGCSPNGLIGRDGDGRLLSCVDGTWQASGSSLTQNNCGWIGVPGGGNGNSGTFTTQCPAGWYMAGYGNYREGDWTRTGEAQILCCAAS